MEYTESNIPNDLENTMSLSTVPTWTHTQVYTHEYPFDMAGMMHAQYPSKCLLKAI